MILLIALSLLLEAARLGSQPLLTPASSPSIGNNLNGPSLIAVPAWVQHPLAKYYLYFAHHEGKYIRLAYADNLLGPWEVYEPGTLKLDAVPACFDHIASPDVHINEQRREIVMYFHCPTRQPGQPLNTAAGQGVDITIQNTLLAVSNDGMHFKPQGGVLGPAYFRVFQWHGAHYAICRGGQVFRSRDGRSKFEPGPELFPKAEHLLRHAAVDVTGDTLDLYFSRIGDQPESILVSQVKLTPDWSEWKASPPQKVLEPGTPYEGADLPLAPSQIGIAPTPVRELRDPFVFRERGRRYLLYTIAGESGIALAELK
jgi:hypothetical protein